MKSQLVVAMVACMAMMPAYAAPAKPAAAAVTPIAIPAPAEGKGQIVFYRTGGPGFALGCGVNENGERISALGAGRYFVHPATAGSHSYLVESEAKDILTLEIEPGETYYVRCKIKMGIMVGRPNIAPSTAEEFGGASAKLKPVDLEDMGPKKAKKAS